MRRLKDWLYYKVIHPLFKDYTDAQKVSSHAVLLERTMRDLDPQRRKEIVATMRKHLVDDIAQYLMDEGYVSITEHAGSMHRPRFHEEPIIELYATIRVYKPLTRS